MADLYVIIAGMGGEVVLILPATIYFLFLLCVVNGIGGHSPLLVKLQLYNEENMLLLFDY